MDIDQSMKIDQPINIYHNQQRLFQSEINYEIIQLPGSPIRSSVNEFQELFPGSNTSLMEFIVSFYSIMKLDGLTATCVNSLLKILQTILASDNSCPDNVSVIHKLFSSQKDLVTLHGMYLNCKRTELIAIKNKCLNCSVCQEELEQFATIDLLAQLKGILDYQNLDQITRDIESARNISNNHMFLSALHGSIYQSFLKAHLNHKTTVSFNLNTDDGSF